MSRQVKKNENNRTNPSKWTSLTRSSASITAAVAMLSLVVALSTSFRLYLSNNQAKR
jgi:hypothetical protein